ncbi:MULTISPECIES: hypothetical protein [Streptomyces]|uniref:hypothetical protein n=1 Tax=Streptomyces TaxID=1883 RepID=UPI0010446FC5|nr:hypothetical protein [Streptomyces sp. BK205]TCR20305.1 hypothetical protein EV578_107245 [Streptomyces sp. BK205]
MNQDQVRTVVLLGILSLLSLIPIAVTLRRARAHRDWDLTATMVFLAGVLANIPTSAYVVREGRPERLDPLGEVVIGFPSWVNRIGVATNGVLLLLCAVFVVHQVLSSRAALHFAPLLAMALATLFAVSDGLHAQQFLAPRQVVLLAVLLAAAVARPGRSAFLGAAAVVLLFSVLGGVEALVEPMSVLRECRADNPCGLLGIHYAGIFTNENILSLFLTLGIPFVWLGLRGRARVFLAFYLAVLAVATGSTLAAVTAVATMTLLVLLRPALPDGTVGSSARSSSPGQVLMVAPILAGTAVLGFALPFLHSSIGDFGDRAVIWDMARGELGHSPFTGFGGNAWSGKYRFGEIPAALSPSLHNQWIDVQYAGGLAGLVLFVLLLAHLLLKGRTAAFPVAACVLFPVLLTSVLERPWSFGISNALSFSLVAALLIPGTARRATAAAAPVSGSSPVGAPARTPRRSLAATAADRSDRR